MADAFSVTTAFGVRVESMEYVKAVHAERIKASKVSAIKFFVEMTALITYHRDGGKEQHKDEQHKETQARGGRDRVR